VSKDRLTDLKLLKLGEQEQEENNTSEQNSNKVALCAVKWKTGTTADIPLPTTAVPLPNK
jgi:hypothetical protein